VSLRRRHDPLFNTEVYEIKIDDDFLMSSLSRRCPSRRHCEVLTLDRSMWLRSASPFVWTFT
jgi:hypothetical protein